MLWMVRTTGNDSVIWQVKDHQKPALCPECLHQDSLQYLGFNESYEPGWQAQMFLCQECDTWVDCVWSTYRREWVRLAPAM